MNKYSIFIILILFSSIYCQGGQKCESSLECNDSICCQNGFCVDNEKCQANKLKVYVAVGILGLIFIILSFIYLYFVISESKKNVDKMRENNEIKGNIEMQKIN